MTGLLLFLMLLSLLIFVGSLIALAFQKWRSKAKWIAPSSFVAAIAFLLLFGHATDEEARQMGFLNSADQRAAKEASVTDGSVWQARHKQDQVEKAAAFEAQKRLEVERQRQAQAQAEALKARREEMLKPPAVQVRFMAAVEYGRAQFKAGQNDLQRGAARPSRAQAICAAMQSSRLDSWIGRIDQLSTNGDGDGVLSIKIADGLYLKTWNNSFSDIGSETLIKSNSMLYQKLLRTKKGDVVRFNGQMFSEQRDCFRETSVTLDGSLREPEFLVRFSDIDPVSLAMQ